MKPLSIAATMLLAIAQAFAQSPHADSQSHLIQAAPATMAEAGDASLPQIGRTTFRVALSSSIKADAVREEQEFTAKTVTRFKIADAGNSAISIPIGALLTGRIATKYPASNGGVSLIFDSISTPDGNWKIEHANLFCRKGKISVIRSGKTILVNCRVFPGAPPGSTVSTAIGAVAAPADGRHLIYWFYRGSLGNCFRTFVVLEKADLRTGDILEVNADYVVKPNLFRQR